MKIGIDYIATGSIIFNAKTYVLMREGKPPLIKGNTLRSRKYEPFIKAFIHNCIEHILSDNYDLCVAEYDRWAEAITTKQVGIDDIKQKQTLNSSLSEYQSKRSAGDRNADGAYELAIKDSTMRYEKGDAIEFYVAEPPMETVMVRNKEVTRRAKLNKSEKVKFTRDYDNDLDIIHYLDRLTTVTKTVLFPIFKEELFRALFPTIKITGADIKKLEKLQEHDYEAE